MKKSILELINNKDEVEFINLREDFFSKLEKAQHEIVNILMMGSYPNFLKSNYFKEYLLTDGKNFVLRKEGQYSNPSSLRQFSKSSIPSDNSQSTITPTVSTPMTCSILINNDPVIPSIIISTNCSRENSTRSSGRIIITTSPSKENSLRKTKSKDSSSREGSYRIKEKADIDKENMVSSPTSTNLNDLLPSLSNNSIIPV